MKCFGFIACSMFIMTSSIAQKSPFSNDVAFRYPVSSFAAYFGDVKEADPVAEPGNVAVSEKVLQGFNSEFSNAGNVSWTKEKKNFKAKFANGSMATQTLFNSKGKMLYSLESGTAKDLPAQYSAMVNKAYPEHIITGVSKLTKKNRQIWVVTTAGKNNDVRARIEDGKMEEVEVINKR